MNLELGSIVTAGRKVGDVEAGMKGVVYELYDRTGWDKDGGTGYGIIFETGFYDGFSSFDLDVCKIQDTGKVDMAISRYRFTNVGRLYQEYLDGWFDLALGQH